jgi:hypothetical protein
MAKNIVMPTKPLLPTGDLQDRSILIYGMPKIGKSTFAASFPGALFLPCEPGLNDLEHYQIPDEGIIESWDELLQAAALIAKGGHDYKTVIVDTVDEAYRMCAEHVCQQRGVEYTGDLPRGKGYAMVNGEFMRVIKKLAGLPQGLILISHAKTRTVEVDGIERDVVGTTLSDSPKKLIDGFVDMILYCDVEEVTGDGGEKIFKRVLRTKPSKKFSAGDRTGRLPQTVVIDQDNPFSGFEKAWAAGAADDSSKKNDNSAPTTKEKK